MKKIILVRHGESEGNVDTSAYARKGDANVELTEKGWEQAQQLGIFLRKHFQRAVSPIPSIRLKPRFPFVEVRFNKWPLFYVSGYMRPKQTLSGAHSMFDNALPFSPREPYTDPRLAEQSFGGLNLLNEMAKEEGENAEFAKKLLTLSTAFKEKDPVKARALFGESYIDNIVAVKSFIDNSLQRDMEDHDTIVIFCHGRVITSFLSIWFHVPFDQIKSVKNPGNCDVLEISGKPRNWQVRRLWDGENFREVDEDPIAHIKPITFDNLPPVPEAFKLKAK